MRQPLALTHAARPALTCARPMAQHEGSVEEAVPEGAEGAQQLQARGRLVASGQHRQRQLHRAAAHAQHGAALRLSLQLVQRQTPQIGQ